MEEHDRYLIAHLQEAFASDERTDELGIEVSVAGDTVVLAGVVATAARRDAVERVAREVLGDAPVRNDVSVADLSAPPTMEHLS
jgi:osmotically-inducible protein OsmY